MILIYVITTIVTTDISDKNPFLPAAGEMAEKGVFRGAGILLLSRIAMSPDIAEPSYIMDTAALLSIRASA